MTIPLHLYRLLVQGLTPALRRHLTSRAQKGKEDPVRLNERYGIASAPPFSVNPIWLHAASVGEAVAALTLIDMIRCFAPTQPILLTTGTVTSARVVAGRLPTNTVHQYAPLDHPAWVTSFLDHWRPCAAIRLESEIWPHMLGAIKARNIPLAMMNARMSKRSFIRWQLFPQSIRTLLQGFNLILADGDVVSNRLRSLGAAHVHTSANIKFLATPPIIDQNALDHLRAAIGNRPCWLYASTHADEEVIAAETHQALKMQIPNVLTIIAPRHPDRRDQIKVALAPLNLNLAWRQPDEKITPQTDLYIADTMGELTLFYAAAPVAMIGRSFSRDGGGGHNPIEAAMMRCYPLSGPHYHNLDTVFNAMIQHGAAQIAPDIASLSATLQHLLTTPAELETLRAHTADAVTTIRTSTDAAIRDALKNFLHGVMS